MSRYSLTKLSKKKLQSTYSKLKKVVSSRVGTFEKHGAINEVPKAVRKLESVEDLDSAELISKVGEISNFLLGKKSKYSDFMRLEREEREGIEEDLGIKFKNYSEFQDYKRFLNDMYQRDKKGWKASSEQYEDAIDLFLNSRRLNLKASQFLRNRDYWLEHVDDLKNAKPIKRSSKLYPSDYARQLRLPKVRGE